jgi:hypothetical protein
MIKNGSANTHFTAEAPTRQFIVPSNANSHRGRTLSLMGYGGGLLRTQKGRTILEVFYSGPGLGLPGRRGTRSKEPKESDQ